MYSCLPYRWRSSISFSTRKRSSTSLTILYNGSHLKSCQRSGILSQAKSVSTGASITDNAAPSERLPPWTQSTGAGSLRPKTMRSLRRTKGPSSPTASNSERKIPFHFIDNPLKLADQVREILQKRDEVSEAHAERMVYAASKSMPCTVAWNHLINYQLSRGRVNAALKTYNNVKHNVV
jgi:hypothetical protein